MVRKLKADNLRHTKPIHTKPEERVPYKQKKGSIHAEYLPPPLILDVPEKKESFKIVDMKG